MWSLKTLNKNLKLILSFLLLFILISLSSSNIWANDELIDKTKTFYVNDDAGILPESLKKYIIDVNANFENTEEKPQVVVATVKTLNNMDVDEYAYKLFEKFEIGNENYNNGILVLLAPDERRIRIEVGYGLEGCITDSKSGMILDSVTDLLSSNNYPDAINIIFDNICNEISTEYGYDASIFTPRSDIIVDFSNDTSDNKFSLSEIIIIIIFLILLILDITLNDSRIILSILFSGSGSSSGGSGGGFSSGGGGGRSGGGGASRGF